MLATLVVVVTKLYSGQTRHNTTARSGMARRKDFDLWMKGFRVEETKGRKEEEI